MGVKDTANLAMIPAAYAEDKVYSVLPSNGDGDFTFTRSGSGTRINKGGYIETMGTNVPRLNYDLTNGTPSGCPSLLLEPSRTNSVAQSNNLSLNWVASSGVTLTANQFSPDGGTNAYKVEMAASGSRFLYITGGTTGVQYTISGYFRADANTSIGFSDGNLSANSIDLTTEWQRFTLTYTSGSSVLIQIDNYFGVSPTQEAKTFYAFGLQAEAGSYATSLIPTSGSAATRTVDWAKKTSGLENILNTSVGTLFFDLTVSSTDLMRISISDSSSGNDYILLDLNGGNFKPTVRSNSGYFNPTLKAATVGERIKIAFTYSSNQIRMTYDGNTPTTTSITYAPIDTFDRFNFSLFTGNTHNWQGKIYQAMYFSKALTDAEMVEITTP